MRLGIWEIALIIMFIIVLFGARKIPDIMRGLGIGIREFKKGMQEGDETIKNKEANTSNSNHK